MKEYISENRLWDIQIVSRDKNGRPTYSTRKTVLVEKKKKREEK